MINLYTDSAWSQYSALVKSGSVCAERTAVATQKIQLLSLDSTEVEPKFTGIPMSAEYELDVKFDPKESSHFYYVLISDCSLEFYPSNPPKLAYSFHITNGDNELPADEEGMMGIEFFACVVLGAGLFFAAVHLRRQHER